MERTNKQNIVIADTSGLVSLLSPTDANHGVAVATAEQLHPGHQTIIVPASVYYEFLNVMGRKGGHDIAAAAAAELVAPFLVIDDLKYAKTTLSRFVSVAAGVSFTDCMVMTIADEYHTTEIFGFDEAFRKNGYVLPGTRQAS